MQGTLLAAAITPDNTPHGYNLTFAFPMLMFIIVAGALYLRFRSSHRVPGHVALSASRWARGQQAPPHAASATGAVTPPAAPVSAEGETRAAEAEQAGSGEQGTEGGE